MSITVEQLDTNLRESLERWQAPGVVAVYPYNQAAVEEREDGGEEPQSTTVAVTNLEHSIDSMRCDQLLVEK